MKSSIKFKTTTPLFLIPFLRADAHRDNGKRFVVHADEKLTAFIELESAIRAV
jgi:hypothetical protein